MVVGTLSFSFFFLPRRYLICFTRFETLGSLLVLEYVLYFYSSSPRDSCCSEFEETVVFAATIIPSRYQIGCFPLLQSAVYLLLSLLPQPACCLSFHSTLFSSLFPLSLAFFVLLSSVSDFCRLSNFEFHRLSDVSSTIPGSSTPSNKPLRHRRAHL